MPRLEIRGLTKVFYPTRPIAAWIRHPWRRGQPLIALERIALTIEPGELFCIMGSNGAGKTTLLRILATLLLPTSGTVRLDGQGIERRTAWIRSQIGFVPGERFGFYDQLTGWQNLKFFAALYGLSFRQATRRVDEVVELVDLQAPHQQFQEYSTGMKQRFLLARALLHDPPLLLLDEPTKSLDPVQTEKFHTMIKDQLNRQMKKTILFTTHQVWEAEALGQRMAILHRGSLVASGTVDQVAQGRDLAAVIQQVCR